MNPDGTQDKNALSLYETSNGQSLTYDTIDGSGDTAALKVTSHATDIHVSAKRLIGGSENLVDLNNGCSGITVIFDEGQIHGKYGISSKTCNDVTFVGHMVGAPTQWHCNLGSWSDQSSATQTNTHLALTADSYPIVVWIGNADIPTLDDPTKYRIVGFGRHGPFVRAIVMFLWGIGKRLHLA